MLRSQGGLKYTMSSILYLLNCSSICSQTWFDSTSSKARMFFGKLDYYVQGQGHSEGSKCQWMFVWMISSELQNTLVPNLGWWCSIMSQKTIQKKKCLLSARSRSQWGLIWSKYDSFYDIFWTVESLATRLGQMIHHYKPGCLVKKLDYCFQGQGHSKGSNVSLSRWYLLSRQTFL